MIFTLEGVVIDSTSFVKHINEFPFTYTPIIQTRQCLQDLSVSVHKIHNRMKVNHLNFTPHQHQQKSSGNNGASLLLHLRSDEKKTFAGNK